MACSNCDPALVPSGARKGPGHFALRFKDHRSLLAYKDGRRINDAVEVEVPRRALRYTTRENDTSEPVWLLCVNGCQRIGLYWDESGGFSGSSGGPL